MNQQSILPLFLLFLMLFSPLLQAGKLAIVIDDIGYRAQEDNAIYRLPKAIAVAIIPSAPMATSRAKQAFAEQRDVLIHLPMQPQNLRQPLESHALRPGMSKEQISELIIYAREQVPHALGLNNHMGSLATTDQQLMLYLMTTLAEQKLFFLDSKTAGNSVAYQTAKQVGIPALERSIFLDDSDAYVDVERQFRLAISQARRQGVAIMIGHPRKNSIRVLQQGLANLPSDIELVSLSSLWRGEKFSPVQPFRLLFELPAPTSEPPFEAVPLLRGLPKE